MKSYPYTLESRTKTAEDTYILRFTPQGKVVYRFLPGQYCEIQLTESAVRRPFSLASAPNSKILEFCIKPYGTFSTTLSTLPIGSPVKISEPMGSLVWDDSTHDAAFLVGGIGISPVMSMLRTSKKNMRRPTLTLFYGNRTPETKAYEKELRTFQKDLGIRVIDIYSHIPEIHPWKGYRGFITAEILQKELPNLTQTTFFLIGPPVFIGKMQEILYALRIRKNRIKYESIDTSKEVL